jgi:membrane protease YdiL (CAAX protease family)
VAADAADPRVGAVGVAFVAWSLVALPVLAWRTKKLLDAGLELGSRRAFFLSAALQQVLLLVLALVAARVERVELFPAAWPRAEGWAWGAALFAGAVIALLVGWRRTKPAQRARLRQITPAERGDLPPWFVVCLLAGFGEEIAWRGVLFELLQRLGCTRPAAIGVAALGFALAHLVQGWSRLAYFVVFAAGFHVVVEASGNLYAAMFAHAAYDAAAGLILLRLWRDEPASREAGPDPA